jgi:hypothetical protein
MNLFFPSYGKFVILYKRRIMTEFVENYVAPFTVFTDTSFTVRLNQHTSEVSFILSYLTI